MIILGLSGQEPTSSFLQHPKNCGQLGNSCNGKNSLPWGRPRQLFTQCQLFIQMKEYIRIILYRLYLVIYVYICIHMCIWQKWIKKGFWIWMRAKRGVRNLEEEEGREKWNYTIISKIKFWRRKHLKNVLAFSSQML